MKHIARILHYYCSHFWYECEHNIPCTENRNWMLSLLHHGCFLCLQDVVGEDPWHGHLDGELDPAAHCEFQEELPEPKLGQVTALLQGICTDRDTSSIRGFLSNSSNAACE